MWPFYGTKKKVVNCYYCKRIIAERARECVFCGGVQPPNWKRIFWYVFWFMLGISFIFIIPWWDSL